MFTVGQTDVYTHEVEDLGWRQQYPSDGCMCKCFLAAQNAGAPPIQKAATPQYVADAWACFKAQCVHIAAWGLPTSVQDVVIWYSTDVCILQDWEGSAEPQTNDTSNFVSVIEQPGSDLDEHGWSQGIYVLRNDALEWYQNTTSYFHFGYVPSEKQMPLHIVFC